MKTFYTSGGIGDSYIFVCRLYKLSEKEPIRINHYTEHKDWRPVIKEVFELLPGRVVVEFSEKKHIDEWEEEARKRKMFYYPDFSLAKLDESGYIVLQVVSGMKRKRKLPDKIVNKVFRKGYPVVILGSEKGKEIEAVSDLRGMTSVYESIAVIRGGREFHGPQGFLSFVACSQRVPTYVYTMGYEDKKAVRLRIEQKPGWKKYLRKQRI